MLTTAQSYFFNVGLYRWTEDQFFSFLFLIFVIYYSSSAHVKVFETNFMAHVQSRSPLSSKRPDGQTDLRGVKSFLKSSPFSDCRPEKQKQEVVKIT